MCRLILQTRSHDTKSLQILILSFLLCSMTTGCAQQVASSPSRGAEIADPRAWAHRQWDENLVPGQEQRITEYRLDLDHDGTPELFLALESMYGQAGCPHFVFKQDGSRYVLLGQLLMHPRGVRVLPLGEDGKLRIVTYRRLGGSQGDILWMTSRDGQFVVLRQERIHPGDSGTEEGRARLAEVFGIP